jgi:type IV secretion system protein VirB9
MIARAGALRRFLQRGAPALAAVPALLSGFALGACASKLPVPEVPLLDQPAFAAANREEETTRAVEFVEVPKPLPLPGQLKPVAPAAAGEAGGREPPPEERIARANAAARVEPAKGGYINAIQVYPYTSGALYRLYAAVGQVSDIALQPGERLISVSAGDTVRWVVGDTLSGEGKAAVVHILVKPIQPGLTTNLLITTDKRTYHLEMLATEQTYMASLSWSYAASELIALKREKSAAELAANAPIAPGLNPEQLRFRYRIEGDAPWRPQSVFDDGVKVYIQFPSGIRESEAPPLFVVGPDGKPALVNYRMRGASYIVDRLFAAAELRLGTAPQRIVRIVRTDAVWRRP